MAFWMATGAAVLIDQDACLRCVVPAESPDTTEMQEDTVLACGFIPLQDMSVEEDYGMKNFILLADEEESTDGMRCRQDKVSCERTRRTGCGRSALGTSNSAVLPGAEIHPEAEMSSQASMHRTPAFSANVQHSSAGYSAGGHEAGSNMPAITNLPTVTTGSQHASLPAQNVPHHSVGVHTTTTAAQQLQGSVGAGPCLMHGASPAELPAGVHVRHMGRGTTVKKGTGRLVALALEILRLQRGDQAMPERIIRERLGNNPDTSKALRRLTQDGKMLRTGTGGRSNPFLYRVTEHGRHALRQSKPS